MSDQLFQNTDEQEAAYAPQELPAGDPAARRPTDQDTDRDVGVGPLGGPAAGVGLTGRGDATTGSMSEGGEGTSGQTPSG